MRIWPLAAIGVLLTGCSSSTPPAAPDEVSKPEVAQKPGAQPPTEEQAGLKFYPGARQTGGSDQGKIFSATLETSDPASRVVSFYEKELGTKAQERSGLYSVEGSRNGTRYAVAITADKSGTSVSILGERSAQEPGK